MVVTKVELINSIQEKAGKEPTFDETLTIVKGVYFPEKKPVEKKDKSFTLTIR